MKPKTCLGKWSIGLIVIFFLSLATLYLFIALGERGGETFFSNLLLAIPGLSAAASGILAFITGISAIIRQKERALLVCVATSIGMLLMLFLIGEVLFPH